MASIDATLARSHSWGLSSRAKTLGISRSLELLPMRAPMLLVLDIESAGIPLMEKETQHQRCPLCANPAEYRWADSKNTKHFYCTHCGQFEISVEAQKRLEKGPNHR